MSYHEKDSLRYFTFDSLLSAGLAHACFTRRGGVSPAPWGSLNLGSTVGDEAKNVRENLRRILACFERQPESVYDVWQVHSAEAVCTSAPRPKNAPHLKADAILTSQPEVTLLMRFADCVPILLFDPVRKVAGLAHAGWLGTVRRTAAAAVEAMRQAYESRPADIMAGIGPSIACHHYPVGPEVVHAVQAAFGDRASSLLPASDGAVQFDLWKANRLVLEQAGVRQIEMSEICTACDLDNWYSHRVEAHHAQTGSQRTTGRLGVIAFLP